MFFIMQVGGYVFRLNNENGETWVYDTSNSSWTKVGETGEIANTIKGA